MLATFTWTRQAIQIKNRNDCESSRGQVSDYVRKRFLIESLLQSTYADHFLWRVR